MKRLPSDTFWQRLLLRVQENAPLVRKAFHAIRVSPKRPLGPLVFAKMSGAAYAFMAMSAVIFSMVMIDAPFLEQARVADRDAHYFFATITDLGTSGWMLIASALLFLCFAYVPAPALRKRLQVAAVEVCHRLFFFFVAVGASSLIATVIKRMLGRARPRHYDKLGNFEFVGPNIDPSFASFPSGHATTIIAAALALGLIFPKMRVWLLGIAGWIALSRPIIGAHYFSDVVGGAFLAYAVVHLVQRAFSRKGIVFRPVGNMLVLRKAQAARDLLLGCFRHMPGFTKTHSNVSLRPLPTTHPAPPTAKE